VHGDGSTCGGPGELASSASTIRSGFLNYLDPISSSNDWHLRSGSVLIDKGSTASYPSTDRDGRARYNGAAPDVGAYEN
jgi:hypothetical protein